MRAHDPAAAHFAGRPVEILFAKAEAGENLLRLRFELPAAVLIEDVERGLIRLVVRAVARLVLFDQLLRLDQLGRGRHRELEDRFLTGGGGFLREKTDGRTFLDRDRAGIRRSLAENEGERESICRRR